MQRFSSNRARDTYIFIGCFSLGVIAVLLIKSFQLAQIYSTGFIVVVMLLYAFLVTRVANYKLRADQIGDNAYYLGLLFTLSSMAIALYQLSATNDIDINGRQIQTSGRLAEQIIGDFGIALASTIVGILLRVSFQQMRVDPNELEEEVRIGLAEAARDVRNTLDRLKVEMDSFFKIQLATLGESNRAIIEDVRKTVTDVAQQMSDVGTHYSLQLRAAGDNVIPMMSTLGSRLEAAAQEFNTVVAGLSRASDPLNAMQLELSKINRSLKGSSEKVSAIVETIGPSVDAVLKMHTQSFALLQSIEGVAQNFPERERQMAATLAQAAAAHGVSQNQMSSATQKHVALIEDFNARARQQMNDLQNMHLAIVDVATRTTTRLSELEIAALSAGNQLKVADGSLEADIPRGIEIHNGAEHKQVGGT